MKFTYFWSIKTPIGYFSTILFVYLERTDTYIHIFKNLYIMEMFTYIQKQDSSLVSIIQF